MQLDPEASAMAGLFYAEQLPPTKRRQLLLQDLKKRAQCQKLGEIVQRVGLLLGLLLGLSFHPGASLEAIPPLSESPSSLHAEAPPWVLFRGNTGG